jgi:MFS family permease
MSMFLVGTVIGPVVGGFAAENFGLGAPFTVYGLCATFSAVLVWRTISPDTVTEVSSRPISARQLIGLLRKYDVITINLATVCVFVVRQGVLNTLVPIFGRLNIGLTLSELGVVLSVGAVGNLATMLLAGTLTDRFGRKRFFLAGLGLTAVFTALLPFAADPLQLTGIIVGLSLSLGLSGPAAAWLTDVVEPGELGGAMGLFRTIGDLGFVLAPVTLAAVAGTAGTVAGLPFFLAAGAVLLLTVPLMWTRDPVAEMRKADLNV